LTPAPARIVAESDDWVNALRPGGYGGARVIAASPPPPPNDDAVAVKQLQRALDAALFDADSVAAVMQAEGPNLTPSPKQVPALLRTLPPSGPLATLIRLFVAGVPVPVADAAAALAPLELDDAVAMHVMEIDRAVVRAPVRLVPVGPLRIACDLTPDPARLPRDVVMGVSATSWALANLTVRRPTATAADVGTGCGIQALLVARHTGRVTATDANPRALAFARFNAALNDVPNIDFVEGDLFEPLEGRFDLVVANPPFVISPDHDYRYRDGGWARDGLSRHVVEGVAGLLREGGFGHALVSWVQDPDDHWSSPLEEWVTGLGCDAWLLHFESAESHDYAMNWNQPLEADPERHSAAVGRWLDYFTAEAIDAIGYGAVVLRRRSGATNWVRAHSPGTPPLGPAGDQVRELFRARDYLDRLEDRDALLDVRLAVDDDHRLEQVLRLRDGDFRVEHAMLHLERALPVRAAVDAYTAEVLTRLEPTRTLAEAFEAAADAFGVDQSDGDRDDLRRATVELVEHMVELGFVRPA
jgi:methylase of polypeptide subunit release factors